MPEPGYVLQADDLDTLEEALRALDDASTIVDAGEGEEHAYQHEQRALYALLERLAPGRASWFALFGLEVGDAG